MRRALLTLCLGLTLLIGLAGANLLHAASAVQQVTITVIAYDGIAVPERVGLLLQGPHGDREGDKRYHTQVKQRDAMQVWHNLRESRRVVAEAMPGERCDGNDISLTCDVQGGKGPATLVRDGVCQGAREVRKSVPAGYHSLDMTWAATATTGGTPQGVYGWSVRFTMTDD